MTRSEPASFRSVAAMRVMQRKMNRRNRALAQLGLEMARNAMRGAPNAEVIEKMQEIDARFAHRLINPA